MLEINLIYFTTAGYNEATFTSDVNQNCPKIPISGYFRNRISVNTCYGMAENQLTGIPLFYRAKLLIRFRYEFFISWRMFLSQN